MKTMLRATFAAAMAGLLAASLAVPEAAAQRARFGGTEAYDGIWSVVITTLSGDCNPTFRYPLRIVNGQVLKADDDPNYQVYGAVRANGAIGVTVSGGGRTANGSGRLTRTYGSGNWRTSTGQCSGQWTAVRRS